MPDKTLPTAPEPARTIDLASGGPAPTPTTDDVIEPVSLPAWQGVGARVLAGRAVHGLLAGGAANDR